MSAVPWLFRACESTRRSPVSRAIAIARLDSSTARSESCASRASCASLLSASAYRLGSPASASTADASRAETSASARRPAEPLEAREPPQARAEPEGIAELPSQRDGLGLRDHRVARRPDGVRLDGVFLEQVGRFGRLESVGVRSGRPVVRRRLPVRTRRGGIPRRPRRPLDDRVDVTRRECMVHQPRRVGDARREQCGEHTAFEFDATRRGQGVDDRTSGELVAELHAVGTDVEQASLLGGAEGALGPGHQPSEQVAVDRRGHDGELLDVILGLGVEAAEAPGHRVDHGRRHARLVGRCDEFADEVRVALGHREDAVGVEPALGGQRADRVGRRRRSAMRSTRSPWPRSPSRRPSAWSRSSSSRYVSTSTAGRSSMRRARKRSTSSVASSAQCTSSMTSTVPGAADELVTERVEDVLAVAGAQRFAQARSDRRGEVAQRPERARRRHRVARPDEHAHAVGRVGPQRARRGWSCRCPPRRTAARLARARLLRPAWRRAARRAQAHARAGPCS